MRFTDVPGLTAIKEKLIQSVSHNKIAHAQLFLGSEGALNLPLALAYSQYLHCENKGEDACGTCAACSKSTKYIHPDTHFVFPLGNIKEKKEQDQFKAEILKTWRSFLTEQPYGKLADWITFYGGEDKQAIIAREESREIIKTLALRPFESIYKVMIIWQPEFMHPSAANGILKILEEPSSSTVFLLVTNAYERLLPTILSRVQAIKVPLLTDDEISNSLADVGVTDKKKLHEIVQMANGDLSKAFQLMDREADDSFEYFFDWMLACYGNKFDQIIGLADQFHQLDKLGQQNLFQYSLSMFREALLQLSGAEAIHRISDNELDRVRKFSKIMDIGTLDRFSHLVNEASYHLERNGSAKMIFTDLSLRFSSLINPVIND